MAESAQDHSLAQRGCPNICLKPERLECWYFDPYLLEWCAWFRFLMDDVGSSSEENIVDYVLAVTRAKDFSLEHGLHESWVCKHHRAKNSSAACRNHLSASSKNRLGCKFSSHQSCLDTLDWFLAQRALSRCPLKTLNHRMLNLAEPLLVSFKAKREIDEHIGPLVVRAKCPY